MEENPRNEELRNIFQRVAAEYGYSSVDAEYLSTKDLKVRWQRGYDWINFQVSDYLDDAPEEVLEGLARNLCERLTGKASEFSKALKDWVTRPEFCEQKQPIFIERSMGLLNEVKGEHKDLNESLRRLREAGLIKNLPQVYITWEDTATSKMGRCSVLMKVVSVNTFLDNEDVPDYVLDYCLYRELLHIQIGYNPEGDSHDEEYFARCGNYSKCTEADSWLRSREVYA